MTLALAFFRYLNFSRSIRMKRRQLPQANGKLVHLPGPSNVFPFVHFSSHFDSSCILRHSPFVCTVAVVSFVFNSRGGHSLKPNASIAEVYGKRGHTEFEGSSFYALAKYGLLSPSWVEPEWWARLWRAVSYMTKQLGLKYLKQSNYLKRQR